MSHHAYLIVGEKEAAQEVVLGLFELEKENLLGDPDVQVLSFETFGIDDVRLIERWAGQSPVGRPHRSFIISFSDITHETQNALLKLFEEPPLGSRFALVVPREDRIIPTLRSRVELVRGKDSTLAEGESAESFLAMPHGKRLSYLGELLKDESKHRIPAFLDALEHGVRKKGNREGERAVLFVRKYFGRRGSSAKMLLEHLSLSI